MRTLHFTVTSQVKKGWEFIDQQRLPWKIKWQQRNELPSIELLELHRSVNKVRVGPLGVNNPFMCTVCNYTQGVYYCP